MARGQTNKLYRTFNKGLITEAGPLTYPEDASVDELNTVLHKKGNRSRRLGLDYEPDSTGSVIADYDASATVSEYLWRAVDNQAGTNFLCIQVGHILHFYDTSSSPITAGKKSFTVDLTAYKAPTATISNVQNANIHMASGKGFLFVAQQFIDPFTVEYDAETDTISVVKIVIQMRDFDGVNDNLANDEEPSTLSPEHEYNLKNQGWVPPGSSSSTGGTGGGGGTGEQTYYNPHTGQSHSYKVDGSIPGQQTSI